MKRFRVFAILPLFLMNFFADAQIETVAPNPKRLQQVYFSYGLGVSVTNAKNTTNFGKNGDLSLTATFKNNLIIRAGIKSTLFQDNQPASVKWREDRHFFNLAPNHIAASPHAGFGKRKLFSRKHQIQVIISPGYTIYYEPVNVIQTNADLGFLGSYATLDYKMVEHRKPGVLLQAEGMLVLSRFAGLTLRTYYHFIPKFSNGGINLSLNLGRIRTKDTQML